MMRIEITHDGRVLRIDEDNFNRLYLLAHGHVAHANAEALTQFIDEAPDHCITMVEYPGMEGQADYPIVIEPNYNQGVAGTAVLDSEDLRSLMIGSIEAYDGDAKRLRYLHDTVPAALRGLADEYETECRNVLKDAS